MIIKYNNQSRPQRETEPGDNVNRLCNPWNKVIYARAALVFHILQFRAQRRLLRNFCDRCVWTELFKMLLYCDTRVRLQFKLVIFEEVPVFFVWSWVSYLHFNINFFITCRIKNWKIRTALKTQGALMPGQYPAAWILCQNDENIEVNFISWIESSW